jgi:hypothetical protein
MSQDGGKNVFYRIPEDVRTISKLIDYLDLDVFEMTDFLDIAEEDNFPDWVVDVDTLNEYWGDSFYRGNVLKTFWLHRGKRHSGTNKTRELNKRKWYLNRLKDKQCRRVTKNI